MPEIVSAAPLIDSVYVYNKKTDMVSSNVAASTCGQAGAGAGRGTAT
jgi:hypothetical protein